MIDDNKSNNLLKEIKFDNELKKLSDDLNKEMKIIDEIFDKIEKEILDENKRNINRE